MTAISDQHRHDVVCQAASVSLTPPDRPGFLIIDRVSLELRRGQVTAIVGPNGSGKTSLIRLLAGLITPSAGTVRLALDGSPGVVFQNPDDNLVPWRTVLDNVALRAIANGDSRQQARDSARNALRIVGLEDFAKWYPRQLSGGQQQLVAIARWTDNPPALVFIDEGFSMLDFVQRRGVFTAIRRLADQGVAVCLVSHHLAELGPLLDAAIVLGRRPAVICQELRFTEHHTPAERAQQLWDAANSVFGV